MGKARLEVYKGGKNNISNDHISIDPENGAPDTPVSSWRGLEQVTVNRAVRPVGGSVCSARADPDLGCC